LTERREEVVKPVMLATDGSPTAAEAAATAIELAQLLDTKLVIVTAWDVPYTTVGFGAPIQANSELAKLSEEGARKVLAEAAARAEEAGVKARPVLLRGMPIQEICLAAEAYGPRFLVIGSHGWGVVKRALFGSVSTGVLHQAACPVLVVRGSSAQTNREGNVKGLAFSAK
jgi:nucleotide-binding universal stress UspA family protein